MAKLKVFTWSDGFHAFTVATTSRPKALAAWGIGQDLFQSGLAHEIDKGPDHDAALAKPGEVIQRGEAVDRGALSKPAKPTKPKGPTAAQKARVKALEAELEALDADQTEALDAINDRMATLQVERTRLERDQKKQRDGAVAKLKTARARL